MHRAIVQASLPCLVALFVGFALLWLLALFSGAKFKPGRLWGLHQCQSGAVQSLSFVLTLPAFLLVMLFIIQVSQLMIGLVIVQYAAYAGARSAAVWIPAELPGQIERENVILGNVRQDGDALRIWPNDPTTGAKYQKIHQAVVQACVPICPSRDLQKGTPSLPSWVINATQSTNRIYTQIAPGQQSNPRISKRIENKFAYSYQNTYVIVEWLEARHPGKDVEGPLTYNPRGHPNAPAWNPNEVGFQDPLTIYVVHKYALMSSAGKFLASHLVPNDPFADQFTKNTVNYKETVYSVDLMAACTLSNEGFKSVIPYVQP